jgi:FAD/FMN-containing dehydrogenase
VADTIAAIEALRDDAVALRGSLVLEEASPRIKERVDAWGKPGPGFATMRRMKVEFDPLGLCSPGRFLGGI